MRAPKEAAAAAAAATAAAAAARHDDYIDQKKPRRSTLHTLIVTAPRSMWLASLVTASKACAVWSLAQGLAWWESCWPNWGHMS